MKTHRCRREEEKEEGVTLFEKMKVIYRGGRVKKRVGSHNYSQKTFCLWCRPPTKTSGAVQII